MKHVYSVILIFSLFFSMNAFQAKDLVVATIDGHEIQSGELIYAYSKNRSDSSSLYYDSLKNYLDQYINFKLKVMEARELGLDTSITFKNELTGYISQLRKPYLENPKAEVELIEKVYERMQWEVNASHILLKLLPNAEPKDTLRAYQLIDSLRSTISNRSHFEQLARQFSQDGSARNGGKLGWFTAMDMVSSFEDAAYQTEVDQVSEVIKTRFGYHILYVNDKRLSRGKLKTSHIFLTHQQRGSDQSFKLTQAVYDSIVSGADWDAMARKYSDDSRTKMNGGQLPWARIRQLPDDFMDIAYSLKEVGDISTPSRTQFGWHIVKLDGVDPLPKLNVLRGEIANQLKRMGRNTLNTEALITKLKTENNFVQNDNILKEQIGAIARKAAARNGEIFNLGGKSVSVEEFENYLLRKGIASGDFNNIMGAYEKFEEEYLFTYEDSIAPTKYPDYGYLLKEYEEGLLLFEVMQKTIWDKGLEDSVGLQKYYQDYLKNYSVGKRYKVDVVSSTDNSLVKRFVQMQRSNPTVSTDSLLTLHFSPDEQRLLKIVKRIIKADEIPNFESTELKSSSWIEEKSTGEWYLIYEVLAAGYYDLDEIRGRVISDYQDFLDQQWITQLRKKRKIKVDKKALKKLSTN